MIIIKVIQTRSKCGFIMDIPSGQNSSIQYTWSGYFYIIHGASTVYLSTQSLHAANSEVYANQIKYYIFESY